MTTEQRKSVGRHSGTHHCALRAHRILPSFPYADSPLTLLYISSRLEIFGVLVFGFEQDKLTYIFEFDVILHAIDFKVV